MVEAAAEAAGIKTKTRSSSKQKGALRPPFLPVFYAIN
jgi:hypothetical protein